MTKHDWVSAVGFFMLGSTGLYGHSFGPPPRVTGAPGDFPGACTQCHTGTALNGGGGSVAITLPNGSTYSSGVKQHIIVHVSDPAQKRWGFELTARLNSAPATAQAGDLASTDAFTQTFCDDGNPKPCSAANSVQFISHTSAGTRSGTSSGVTFEFDWTPPSTDAGPVTLYVAGNAANGNSALTGDHIYTASIQLTPAASTGPPKPVITSNGVVNAASFGTTVAPNAWVTILGSNFTSTTRGWTGTDIVNGSLPTSLDGVSVMINNKPAYVEFISPSQINVLAPDDGAVGPVQVQVKTGAVASDPTVVQMQPFSPAFFLFDGKYLAATHANASAIGKPGLFPSAPSLTTPAKPGEVIILYGTGFGATDPALPSGQLVGKVANVTSKLQVTIGGVAAQVLFAGLIPGYAGLFQFNVEVPAAVGDGDLAVVAQVAGSSTPTGSACCFVTVQH